MAKQVKNWRRQTFPFLIWVVALMFILAVTSWRVSYWAEASCFRTLRETTKQTADDIYQKLETDARLLEQVADVIGEVGVETDGQRTVLDFAHTSSMIDSLQVMLPDGRLICRDGTYLDAPEGLEFPKEGDMEVHMTGRLQDPLNAEEYVVYRTYPIIRDGEVFGLLCGVIDLDKQREAYKAIFDKNGSRFHLIDRRSGEFLIDTTHDVLGTVEGIGGRTMKSGYTNEKVQNDLRTGTAGETAFFSNTVQEYLYGVYLPIGDGDWMVFIGTPESVAFQELWHVREVLYSMSVVEALLLGGYFLWIIVRARRESRERETQLNRVHYMLEVEGILFNAPRNPEMFYKALERTAQELDASRAFFMARMGHRKYRKFYWRDNNTAAVPYDLDDFPELLEKFFGEKKLVVYDTGKLATHSEEERNMLKKIGIENMMVIPVQNQNNKMVGALGVANMRTEWQTTELLESVMLAYSMAVTNLEAFSTIEEMGARDHLTGLRNRASFQEAMEEHEKQGEQNLACLYIDADRLHEINNTYGHESGDKLLRAVADAMRASFGDEEVFRTGGDEFVAFMRCADKKEAQKRADELEKTLEQRGYLISVGVEHRKDTPLLSEMIKAAELEMFEMKRRHHQEAGMTQRNGAMDQELEKTLEEKRDLDIFKEVMNTRFLGVYLVDMAMDTCHCITAQEHFLKSLEQAGGKYSEAMEMYIENMVEESYRKTFRTMMDYEKIEGWLKEGETPSLRYRRTDGQCLGMKIYISPEYSKMRREAIWTFEVLSDLPWRLK